MDWIEDYLAHLERRNRAPTTIGHYRFVIGRCTDILKGRGMSAEPEDIGDEHIALLMSELDVGESTMKNFLNILGRYCEHFTGRNPVKRMDLLWNRGIVKRKFIDRRDLALLLEHADPSERMVLILGAYMGLRRKEIALIRLEDIGRDSIKVSGKGHGKKGLVVHQPMPLSVADEISRYLEWRRTEVDGNEDHLIVMTSDKETILMDGHLPAMSNRISRLGSRLGLDVSCHSLRRLYCTTLAESGCPLETIKVLMRHSDINTTLECYIKPRGLHLEEWTDICSEELDGEEEPEDDIVMEESWLQRVHPMTLEAASRIGLDCCTVYDDYTPRNAPKVTKSEDNHSDTLPDMRYPFLSRYWKSISNT